MNGKEIVSIDIWNNGTFVSCNWLIITLVFDDLINVARFYYEIGVYNVNEGFKSIANGNEVLTGDDYETWGESQNINDEAYILIAEKLNLQIV